jgi:hypothetical protein
MSQDTSGARISHAHSVDSQKEGKLGEASKTLNQQFAKAAELRQEQQKQAQGPEWTGSEMVQQAGPKHNLTPPQAMREGPDRQAHQAALARDTARAQQINAQAKARQDHQKQAELKSERHQDYGRER